MTRTQDWIDAIEWMRAYRASGGRIEFAGNDIVEPQFAIDSVLAFLRRADPAFVNTAAAAYADMAAAWREENWIRPDSVYSAWKRGADEVHARLLARRIVNASATDTSQASMALQNARLAVQAARYITGRKDSVIQADEAFRDSAMAENTLWLLRRHGPSARMIVSAHNMHVGRYPARMGGHLAQALGRGYVVIGATTFEGVVSRNVGRPRPRSQQRYAPVELVRSPARSFEDLLHSHGMPFQLVDLRGAAADPVGAFLTRSRPMRSNDVFISQPVASRFDAIVFIDKTGPVERLR
jgi:erythromycin esterase-like protein